MNKKEKAGLKANPFELLEDQDSTYSFEVSSVSEVVSYPAEGDGTGDGSSEEIIEEQILEVTVAPNSGEGNILVMEEKDEVDEALTGVADENVEGSDDESFEYDEDLILEAKLLDAQQQWNQSLQQLSKVFNWVVLPLLGKFLGRKVAGVIWKRVMDHVWKFNS